MKNRDDRNVHPQMFVTCSTLFKPLPRALPRGRSASHVPLYWGGWETRFVAPNGRLPIVHDGNLGWEFLDTPNARSVY